MSIKELIKAEFDKSEDKIKFINELRSNIHSLSPNKNQPVDYVRWTPVDMVEPNDYNPNSVARKEMSLLYTSIYNDGYTQPIVTIWDDKKKKFIIVDGFHRYYVCKTNKDILERNNGCLPIVVINKSINERMASTVRHNRARGRHSVSGMSNMVFELLDNGWRDEDICNQLGLEAEELLKLKHITGFSKLFENTEYKQAWESKTQILERKKWQDMEKQ